MKILLKNKETLMQKQLQKLKMHWMRMKIAKPLYKNFY